MKNEASIITARYEEMAHAKSLPELLKLLNQSYGEVMAGHKRLRELHQAIIVEETKLKVSKETYLSSLKLAEAFFGSDALMNLARQRADQDPSSFDAGWEESITEEQISRFGEAPDEG